MFDFIKKIFFKDDTKKQVHVQKPIEFKIGESITVYVDDNKTVSFQGKIQNVGNKSFSIVLFAKNLNPDVHFRNNRILWATARKDTKTANFDFILIRYYREYESDIIECEYPLSVKWEETKQRQHFRIDTDIPAKIKSEKTREDTWEMVRIKDLSISGMAFETKSLFEDNDIITIKFLSMKFPLITTGMIIRPLMKTNLDDGSVLIRYGVRFIGLSDIDQQLLTDFIFHLQRMGI